ncbi:FeoC-like transcriptional regulator [Legionella nagasakiensis]|uniref:FeoC-like transcriptional regulator n=1 Tax=Legionella nagasakiensis TaxID=535290 RepID=UPI0010550817|nr:FeoC-like transcriptional regulator [Legionella nagasakiensis]
MLLQIREFITREKVVSIQQLARAFHLDEQALQPMLTIWVNKGVIRPCQGKAGCQSSCFRCNSNAPIFYQLV